MNHSEIRSQMADYLEGDLPLDRRALFDAHLDECRECAREIAEMRMTIGALRSLPDPEPPALLAEDVMRRIRLGEGSTSLLDRLREVGSALLSPRILAPVSVAAIAAGVLLGTQPLRGVIESGGGTIALRAEQASGRAPVDEAAGGVVVTRSDADAATSRLAGIGGGSVDTAAGAPGQRTPGQELIALSELLADRSSRRTRFSDWPAGGAYPSTSAVAPSVSVATRPGAASRPGDELSSRSPNAPLAPRTDDVEQRWPSADEWLAHVELEPVQFADQMAARTLAEQEHWIDSLAKRAVDRGSLDRVVAALRSSRSQTARVLADDFAAAGARYGGTLSASSRSD